MDQIREGDLIMRGPAPFLKENGRKVYEVMYDKRFAASIYKEADGTIRIRVHVVLTTQGFVPFWLALGRLAEKVAANDNED